MNKKLVAIVVAVAVIVIIAVLSLVFKKKPAVVTDTCKEFISALIAGDANKTYNMFTDKAKSLTSTDVWKGQVTDLKGAYTNGSLTLKSTTNATPVGENDTQTRYVYDVKSGSWNYTAACYVIGTQVDAFSSSAVTQ